MATQTIYINEAQFSACEAIINYTFTDKLLLLQALNATSLPISYAGKTHAFQKNDALAVLGDTRMDAVLCRWWWDMTSPRVKAHWTKMRLDKCGNSALVELGRELGLDKCVISNPGTTTVSDKMLATAVEAVLGAVYLDGEEGVLEGVLRGLGFGEHGYL
ncbi:ribonuclease III [Ophiobolus disseminans]|uniref:Ribonuclease III n=1 Tax=Ophiobolus disseminans TaxID=1469910 RepID=A0A6A7AIR0_9PLEO|nr:ribonuclease III [Ophiobolus disseminans]